MAEKKYRMTRRVPIDPEKGSRAPDHLSRTRYDSNQKNTINALRESEAKYRFITENMDDTVWFLDLDLKTKYLSPSITRYSGYSLEETKTLSLFDILTPESKDLVLKTISLELTPERLADKDCHITSSMEASYYKKDGSIDWVDVTSTVVRDADGKPEGHLCVARDISDRKRMEQALKQSESRWQFALEGSGEAVWDWDLTTDKVYYSRRFGELFGSFSPNDWKTLNDWQSRIHPDDLGIVSKKLQGYIDGLEPVYSIEYRFRLSDNSYRWVLDRGMITEHTQEGKPARMVGTFSDISDYRRMEQTLTENEEKFRLLAERSTDIIALHEIDGIYKYVSPACFTLLGFTPEELIGHSLVEFIHPEDRTLVQYVLEHVDEIDEIQPLDYRIRTKFGKYLWMETTALVIRRADTGQPNEIQMTSRNITERVRAEEALRESEVKLRSVITQSQDGITLIDEEGRIIEWSKGQEKISGIPAYQAIGKYIWEVQSILMPDIFRNPEDLENFKRLTLDMLTNGSLTFGNSIQESNLTDVDGRQHRIQTLSFPIHTSRGYMAGSVIRDVTGIKKAEEALSKSEERLRFITDNMLDMISYVNADRNLEYVSPSVTSVAGYREDELIGLSIVPFIHPDDEVILEREIGRCITDKIQNIQVEYRFKHKEGHFIWMEAMVNLLLDAEGKIRRSDLWQPGYLRKEKRNRCFTRKREQISHPGQEFSEWGGDAF